MPGAPSRDQGRGHGIVTGTVIEVVKGGLILDIGLRGFTPGLPGRDAPCPRPPALRGARRLEAKIVRLDKNRNKWSCPAAPGWEQTQSEVRQTFSLDPPEGSGPFRRRLLDRPASVPSWTWVAKEGRRSESTSPSSPGSTSTTRPRLSRSAEVTVEVLDVDMDRERVSLSLKATQENPWQQFARTHQIGQVVPGKVRSWCRSVRSSAWTRASRVWSTSPSWPSATWRSRSKVVQVNDGIFVKVIDIDLERRRIGLSLKQANEAFGADPSTVEFDPTLTAWPRPTTTRTTTSTPRASTETNDWLEGYETPARGVGDPVRRGAAALRQQQAQVIKSREADERPLPRVIVYTRVQLRPLPPAVAAAVARTPPRAATTPAPWRRTRRWPHCARSWPSARRQNAG